MCGDMLRFCSRLHTCLFPPRPGQSTASRGKMRRSAWISLLGAVAAQAAFVSTAEAGPSDAVLVGQVKDAGTGNGIEGAVVVVTGEKLQGERTMTTNSAGLYRIPNLPPGT